jgi:hypothetical protein
MQDRQGRARRTPGPLPLIAVIALAVNASVVRAHDPGLSSLDVTVTGTAISASVSIAPADVALLRSRSNRDIESALRELVHNAVQLSVDGKPLSVAKEDREVGANGARIHFVYRGPESSARMRRIVVSSTLPQRLGRGHRELAVVTAGGRVASESVLDATTASMSVDLVVESPSVVRRAWSFLTLGIGHILAGYDHLVFLAGLILAAATLRELLVALTAFTAAHSISLALVVAGGVHAPPSVVEPLIAASIAWVGIENLRGVGGRSRWGIVFAFGLVHGFGFAGALVELGFGSSALDVALALLSFNGGVEVGQLAAAAMMVPVVWMIRARPAWQARLTPACSMMIVAAGSYWLIERLW